MKKIILILLLTVLTIGCDNNGKPLGYTYLELDSCDYIAGLNQLALEAPKDMYNIKEKYCYE